MSDRNKIMLRGYDSASDAMVFEAEIKQPIGPGDKLVGKILPRMIDNDPIELWVSMEQEPEETPKLDPGDMQFVYGVGTVDKEYWVIWISTPRSLPYVSDHYEDNERDYIHDALHAIGINSGEMMEGHWEIHEEEAKNAREKLKSIPGFEYSKDFEKFIQAICDNS